MENPTRRISLAVRSPTSTFSLVPLGHKSVYGSFFATSLDVTVKPV